MSERISPMIGTSMEEAVTFGRTGALMGARRALPIDYKLIFKIDVAHCIIVCSSQRRYR